MGYIYVYISQKVASYGQFVLVYFYTKTVLWRRLDLNRFNRGKKYYC